MAGARTQSAAAPLALAYVALVLYASLYPFAGWRWPPGQTAAALLMLPQSPYHDRFDIWSNVCGYMPLGALLTIVARRRGAAGTAALCGATLAASLVSYACEVLQHFVPGRVPSFEDLVMNGLGALGGALLALAMHAWGWVDGVHGLRRRWFDDDSATALTLLALWPVGLLFPSPVPLGLGQIGERLRERLAQILDGVPWADAAHAMLATAPAAAAPLRPLVEAMVVSLGLVAPCMVAHAVIAPGWRRAIMAAGCLLAGVGGMSLSTWLNFGPQHALAWLSPATAQGLGLGLAAGLVAAWLPRRLTEPMGLIVLTGLVMAVAQAPDNPYFAQSLQSWEQGRFVRFHGLAQWIGWLWPYAALAWLLARLSSRRGGTR